MQTTTVASSTGATSGATTPPETIAPRCSVANRAASSALAFATKYVTKNRTIGRKSRSIVRAFGWRPNGSVARGGESKACSGGGK